MKHSSGAALLTLALAGCGGGGTGVSLQPDAGQVPVSFCGSTSWVAGVTELCAGKLVYRDYVYDDYGADTGRNTMPIAKGALSPSAGDIKYPAGAENTADLVRFELGLDGDDVVVEYELNTLYDAAQTVAALAIDTDNDPATGGGELTGLGVSAPGWDVLQTFTTGDPATNLIRGRFARPAGEVWKIWAVVAQADGTVMNVAFRGTQEEAKAGGSSKAPDSGLINPAVGTFWEDKQAAALGAADITPFAVSVALADLHGSVTRGALIPAGFHQRVYTSAFTLAPGEGVSLGGVRGSKSPDASTCGQFFHYLGKYQPYGLYIPARPGPHGLQFDLHGCSANHASIINQPGFQQKFGEELNRVLVVPLGRGPVGFYSDISERDVLDVFSDVMAHYAVDPDAVVMGGYSMGGYGTLRFAALYPDFWAAATNWVGFTGNVLNAPFIGDALFPIAGGSPPGSGLSPAVGAVGNVIDFIQNLRHIPTVSLYSGGDELVQVNTGLAMRERFADSEVEHEFYLHPNAEHLTYVILDDWDKEADFSANRRRVRNPARITYRTDESLAFPEYGIQHDRAYWISAIRGAAPGYIDLDLKTLGCGAIDPVYESGDDGGEGPPPLVWIRHFTRITGGTPVPEQNRLEGALANVASLTIDSTAACLRPGMSYKIESSAPAALSFGDGRVLNLAAGSNEGVF